MTVGAIADAVYAALTGAAIVILAGMLIVQQAWIEDMRAEMVGIAARVRVVEDQTANAVAEMKRRDIRAIGIAKSNASVVVFGAGKR